MVSIKTQRYFNSIQNELFNYLSKKTKALSCRIRDSEDSSEKILVFHYIIGKQIHVQEMNMATVNIYLKFNGNCREAFDFYKSALGGEYSYISTFGDMPPQKGMPPLPEADREKIMHVSLPVSEETILMGSDTTNAFGGPVSFGNNFSISLDPGNRSEADRLFAALSEGGKITMPLDEMFWGDYFGSLTDKFGINWMVNCNA